MMSSMDFRTCYKLEGPKFQLPHYQFIGFLSLLCARSELIWPETKTLLSYIKKTKNKNVANHNINCKIGKLMD